MPLIKYDYDPVKIERLKHFLCTSSDNGNPKDFEIFVDALKVIPRTDEIEQFDTFEEFVNEDTERIRILIYNSQRSPRNDQHLFILKKAPQEGLNGPDVDRRIQDSLERQKREWETEQLRKELSDTREKLKEAEEYIENLEEGIEIEKKNKLKLGDVHWGEIASVALEGVIRRNTGLIAKIPGAENLAGIIQRDNEEKKHLPQLSEPDSEVSFSRAEQGSSLSEADKEMLGVLNYLQEHFSEEELSSVRQILEHFSKHPSLISDVLELLREKPSAKDFN